MSSKPRFVGEKVKLGDVATYVNGYAFKPSDYSDSGLPIVRIQNLTGNAYRTNRYEGTLPEKFAIQDGDILISWSASLGVFEWNQGSAWLNQHIFRVVFNKAMIDKRFFVHQARFLIQKSQNLAHGATMKHLTKKVFEMLPFLYLGLNNQKMIAEQLDALDTQINRAKRQIRFLDNLVKSRFVEMFGRAEDEHSVFPVKTLDDVCASIVRGPFGSALKKEFFVPKGPGVYKVYEQKHAIRKQVDIGTYYISSDRFETLKRFECHPGDILMSCSGTMGRLYQLPPNCEPGVMNQALCKFTLSDSILVDYFLGFMEQVVDELGAKGSGIKNVSSVKFIKAIRIPLPPVELQGRFAAFVSQVDKSRFIAQQQIEKLQVLYDSLAQDYFGD